MQQYQIDLNTFTCYVVSDREEKKSDWNEQKIRKSTQLLWLFVALAGFVIVMYIFGIVSTGLCAVRWRKKQRFFLDRIKGKQCKGKIKRIQLMLCDSICMFCFRVERHLNCSKSYPQCVHNLVHAIWLIARYLKTEIPLAKFTNF